MNYLRPGDGVSNDADALVSDAKRLALGMARSGWSPQGPKRFKLPDASGRSAIEMMLYDLQLGGKASEHDVKVGKRIAHVLTGGDIPSNTWVDEQYILDLEREAFLSLCGEEKTRARSQHFLTKKKVLRN